MTYAIKIDGAWVEVAGHSVDLPDRTVSQAWVEGLASDERQALGFIAITGPTAAPGGQRIAATTIQDIAGRPVRVATYEAIPAPPVPDEVPMWKVRKLLILMGKLAEVEAALAAITGIAGEVARSNWQTAPNLVRADPLVQGMATTLAYDLDALCVAANALT